MINASRDPRKGLVARSRTASRDGFDMARDQVQALVQQLGIYDLAQFTPS